MIAGVYKDYGEPGIAHFSERDERYWDHGSLIYNLLSKEKKHQLRSQGHVSRDVDHLIRAAPPPKVEIAQPAPDILEVMVWSGINDRLMLRRDVLSMDKGDFSCGPDGLRLRSHTELFVWGISNAYGSVSRTLNRSEDGSLVMKIEERLFGLHVFVPLGLSSDYWVRWTPIARSSL